MSGWKKISNNLYSYRDFEIEYSIGIIERRAVDVMRATKEVVNEQEKIQKPLETTGDSFKEVKEKIIQKIDAFYESQKIN